MRDLSEARVKKIHEEMKIFDCLATPYLDNEYIRILKSIGINTVHYTVAFTNLVHMQNLDDDFVTACRSIGRWNRILDENKNDIELVFCKQGNL